MSYRDKKFSFSAKLTVHNGSIETWTDSFDPFDQDEDDINDWLSECGMSDYIRITFGKTIVVMVHPQVNYTIRLGLRTLKCNMGNALKSVNVAVDDPNYFGDVQFSFL